MTIQIDNPDLERRLEELGARQPIPVKKTPMAVAILRAAVEDDRGQPIHKWRDRARKYSEPDAA